MQVGEIVFIYLNFNRELFTKPSVVLQSVEWGKCDFPILTKSDT